MTSAGVVAKALIDDHSDFLRDTVAMIAAEIMEAEIERQVGAGRRRGLRDQDHISTGPTIDA